MNKRKKYFLIDVVCATMLLFMNMGKRLKTHKDTISSLSAVLPEYTKMD
jgi:hypothetical protein